MRVSGSSNQAKLRSSARSRLHARTWSRSLVLLALSALALPVAAGAGAGELSGGGSTASAAVRKTGFEHAFILPVEEEINDVTLESLERRVEEARQGHADLIVIELNTPGGVALTALKICTLIKNLEPIHTVAWVNPDAYSAGAIIALACDEIVMSARSKIGDCQPIMIGPEGVSAVPEDVEAKFNSPLIEELQDSSNRHGYDMSLCLAMIRPDGELYWLENTKTGERRFVHSRERDRLFGLTPAAGTDTDKVDAARDEKASDKDNDKDKDKDKDKGKDEKSQSGARREPQMEFVPDEASKTDWRYVRNAPPLTKVPQPVVGRNELLTMGQDSAIAYGFARAKISSEGELRDYFGIRGPITRLTYTWTEELVDWLSQPMVRGVLFILMMLGAYVEFNHPGLSVPGIVAAVCLLIFLGAPYLTGLARAWEILVIICGAGLLLLELFVIPGFGITGIAGILLVIIGFVATFMPPDPGPIYRPEFNYTVDGVKTGLWVIAVGLIASLAGMIALSRVLPRAPYLRKLIPANPTPESVAVADPLGEVASVGNIGRTEGPLRPAGKARFGSTLVDVVSDGEFVGPGERVEVIGHEGTRVVVRRIRLGA
jgi:membrane-bound serine protease (ClpP class)